MLASPLVALPEGVTVEQATAEIGAALQTIAPAPAGRVRRVTLRPLADQQMRGGTPTARVLLAGALLVFVLAAMNLVHLTLGRAIARSQEFTIRASLGASRWRLLRLGVVDALLLAVTGIGAGLALGFVLFQVMAAVVPDYPTAGRNLALVPMVFDARVATAAAMLGLTAAVIGGVLPVWWAGRAAAATGRVTTDRRTSRVGRFILTSELTIAASPGAAALVTPITFETLLLRGIGESRFQAPIVLAFGVLAVVLAAVGVYGVVSYQVEGRTREFAVRIAVGATRLDVWKRVMREVVVPSVLGLVCGSALAWWLERTVESAAFGWSSSGPLAILLVSIGLLVVVILATLRPARRAATVDPSTSLRP